MHFSIAYILLNIIEIVYILDSKFYTSMKKKSPTFLGKKNPQRHRAVFSLQDCVNATKKKMEITWLLSSLARYTLITHLKKTEGE